MIISAHAKHLHISPRKIRLVIDAVRGLPVERAEYVLRFMNKRGAEPVLKVLQSAIANATHNMKLSKKDLVVQRIFANEGATISRYRARAFGRAATIRKRMSHVTVELLEKKQPVQRKKVMKLKSSKQSRRTKITLSKTSKQTL